MSPLARLIVALTAGIAVIAGLIWLGRAASDDLKLVVDQLEVPSPPGMTRAVFLAEVRHESGLPAKLDRTDPTTAGRLKTGFAKHPWVESVEVLNLTQAQPVMVRLRTPALAVGGRVVDSNGVLLPLRTSTSGLPEYRGPLNSKISDSGRPFGDPAVVEAAQRVGWLRVEIPEITWQFVEITPDGLVLTRNDGTKAIWGKNAAGKLSPKEKLTKLRDWMRGDIDLRK